MTCFNIMLLQVTELKMKLGTRSQFSTERKKVDESTKQLQFDIQNLKAQKVALLVWMIFFSAVLVLIRPSFALGIK